MAENISSCKRLFLREIGNTNKAMLPWLFAQKGKYNKMCCPLEPIRPSPTQVCWIFPLKFYGDMLMPSYAHACMHASVSNPIITPFVPLSSSLGRRSTGTSVSSSSQWEQTARIRPLVSAWGNTKAAPAPSSGHPSRATSQPRPKGWSASSRGSSGTLINGNTVTEKNFCSKVCTRQWGLLMLLFMIFFSLLCCCHITQGFLNCWIEGYKKGSSDLQLIRKHFISFSQCPREVFFSNYCSD